MTSQTSPAQYCPHRLIIANHEKSLYTCNKSNNNPQTLRKSRSPQEVPYTGNNFIAFDVLLLVFHRLQRPDSLAVLPVFFSTRAHGNHHAIVFWSIASHGVNAVFHREYQSIHETFKVIFLFTIENNYGTKKVGKWPES